MTTLDPPQTYVDPGQNGWFSFEGRAPSAPGDYRIYFRLNHGRDGLIEDWGGMHFLVRVRACECDGGETQSQACGRCGERERTCQSDQTWGAWEGCEGEGECGAGTVDERDCGLCGTQRRTCSGSCGWGGWSACSGQGSCSPGASEEEPCGRCGVRLRQCTDSCGWSAWSECAYEGVCVAGERREVDCPSGEGTATVLCEEDGCGFHLERPCPAPEPDDPDGPDGPYYERDMGPHGEGDAGAAGDSGRADAPDVGSGYRPYAGGGDAGDGGASPDLGDGGPSGGPAGGSSDGSSHVVVSDGCTCSAAGERGRGFLWLVLALVLRGSRCPRRRPVGTRLPPRGAV